MKARSSLSAALLLFIATPALAEADWALVSSSGNGTNSIYVDRSSIRITGPIRRYWKRVDIVNNPKDWAKTMVLNEDNCATGQNRVLQLTVYNVDGTNESRAVDGETWKYVPLGSVSKDVHDYVCRQ